MYCTGDGLTDIGMVREENQDAYLIDDKEELFAVADGMGGMKNGALASRLALECLERMFQSMEVPEDAGRKEIASSMRTQVSRLSDLLRRDMGPGSGTTLIFVLARGAEFHISNLGDSRAYLFRDDKLERLTKDHNVAAMLLEAGEINPKEAMRHPLRNLVTRYLGMEHAIPEIETIKAEAGGEDNITVLIIDCPGTV